MSLYDRNHLTSEYDASYDAPLEQGRVSKLIKETYALLTASMVAAAAGAYVAMSTGVAMGLNPLLYFILMIGLIFAMQFAVNRGANSLALVLLFAFTFITGLTLGKVLSLYIGAGMGGVVTQAFVATAVTFGALTVYAMNSKVNVDSWGKPLFISLIAVIIIGFLNYFFFKSSLVSLGTSCFSALLFSSYIIYDTKNIINGVYTSPIMAAVGMYLNIYNLFMSLLNILGFANRD
ncbi:MULTISPECIES: Bax inhibitor-1/YccA family protein [unclassified Campylobacter]|uniref:Bax inhibitor-1/YccA family protein n=1 Tax=unclassified Campylobacter TaxID=2593542 RepID=UPI0022E9B170|nr:MULTISPECIES: Bax inhibitor-1/YccA family protein [unclassified Campylobacter]MDA3054736.1 Bax inhibitor-1/YccA family protein [Campylobacter sp. VBCF_07 NA4]MDA3061231.1 Bax inhibitor-1/YccA family protein [Campylobacter sp. VBCF_02 NA5]MDA3070685.1 Bax inhibitor-1/YccA family protein [Campylobacter sp. VBCF_08 NA3]WBR54191.1 Bax inhibitor-1/YccA family protein [Campylobacter sp. VBCF_01 NA2]